MTHAPALRRPLMMLLLVLMAALAGCTSWRTENSKFIEAPFDPDGEELRQAARTAMANSRLKLGEQREYFIGPGDILSFTILGRADIFGAEEGEDKITINVTQNPMVTFPLVGAIKVHGKTAQQLQDELRKAYEVYVKNPVPILSIEKFWFNQVAVLGAVKTPGKYPIEIGDTLLDAIFKAGGMAFGGGSLPPARYLKIYREKLSQKDRAELTLDEILERITEGEDVVTRDEIVVPIESFIQRGDLKYNVPLAPNDVVYVPGAGSVIIHGRLESPGVVFLGPSIRTLNQAMTERGGLRYGAASKVEVVRVGDDGVPVSYFVDARRIRNRKEPDFMLRDNDEIFVYSQTWRAFLETLGDIFKASASTGVNATYSPL